MVKTSPLTSRMSSWIEYSRTTWVPFSPTSVLTVWTEAHSCIWDWTTCWLTLTPSLAFIKTVVSMFYQTFQRIFLLILQVLRTEKSLYQYLVEHTPHSATWCRSVSKHKKKHQGAVQVVTAAQKKMHNLHNLISSSWSCSAVGSYIGVNCRSSSVLLCLLAHCSACVGWYKHGIACGITPMRAHITAAMMTKAAKVMEMNPTGRIAGKCHCWERTSSLQGWHVPKYNLGNNTELHYLVHHLIQLFQLLGGNHQFLWMDHNG